MKTRFLRIWFYTGALCLLSRMPPLQAQVAFLADVHLHDVFAGSGDLSSAGGLNSLSRDPLIRTMQAQAKSTRLFNENYFALLGALDEIVRRRIPYVALPGDFSDDGQPVNVEGLNRILTYYERKHGLRFFAITGNHDPTRPFGKPGGKADFLGAEGKAQPVVSQPGRYTGVSETVHPVRIDSSLAEAGYPEIMQAMRSHGFYPRKEYRYWSTPFSPYTYEAYTYNAAETWAALESRLYRPDSLSPALPDASYLVEPEKGLWLLAIDANVYPHRAGQGFGGSGIGYREVLAHKAYLVDWVTGVVQEARRLGKTLVAFSHYPMVDFNDGATPELIALFGPNRLQAGRIPPEEVARTFAQAGLQVHVAGHMHYNDTGVYRDEAGNALLNIQSPSLAAYPAAFKVLTQRGPDTLEVETVRSFSVPGFDTFFDRYREEHAFRQQAGLEPTWDIGLLEARSYEDYIREHLRQLVTLRFLPQDWPEETRELLLSMNGFQLLVLSQLAEEGATEGHRYELNKNRSRRQKKAERKARELMRSLDTHQRDWEAWGGIEWIFAFFQLRHADQLALRDLDPGQLDQFRLLATQFLQYPETEPLRLYAAAFLKHLHSEPSDHFLWIRSKGQIQPIPQDAIPQPGTFKLITDED